MAGRKGQRKCKICGEWISESEEKVEYKNGFVHRKCFNLAMKVVIREKKDTLSETKNKASNVKPKPQKELKDGLSEEEYAEKRKLCDYIREITKEDVSVVTYSLIEEYKKKYKISYQEMYSDLYWYFELCGHEVESDRVIAIVPKCHTEAQKYYKSIEQSNASCQENLEKLPQMYKETSAAVSNTRRNVVPQIDIAAIGGD
jgi:hypothetical protein